jgi:hypothetical protein
MKTSLTIALIFAASVVGIAGANAEGAYPGTPGMTRLVHRNATSTFCREYDKAMRARGHNMPAGQCGQSARAKTPSETNGLRAN